MTSDIYPNQAALICGKTALEEGAPDCAAADQAAPNDSLICVQVAAQSKAVRSRSG